MGNEMGMVIGSAVAILVMYLLVFGFLIASYIMTSWGLYSIADKRQISNPWLAWLPIGNYWIMGSIADEYDGRNGIKRKWRMTLLILELVVIIAIVVFFVVFFASFFAFAFQFEYIEPEVSDVFGLLIPMYIFMVVLMLVATALQALYMITLYKIFESTVPEKSVKYMLLSLMVPLASAICLMICRNKGYSYSIPVNAPAAMELPEDSALEALPAEEPKPEEIQPDVIEIPEDEE